MGRLIGVKTDVICLGGVPAIGNTSDGEAFLDEHRPHSSSYQPGSQKVTFFFFKTSSTENNLWYSDWAKPGKFSVRITQIAVGI